MSQDIERRGDLPRPAIDPDVNRAAARLPDGVGLPTSEERELVAILAEAGGGFDRMCRTRLYQGCCAHCGKTDPCEAESMVFGFMRGLAAQLDANPAVTRVLVLLTTHDGIADLDLAVTLPDDLSRAITARPDQT